MKAQCEKYKLKDVDTFKLATVLDKTEKYMVHIKYLTVNQDKKTIIRYVFLLFTVDKLDRFIF